MLRCFREPFRNRENSGICEAHVSLTSIVHESTYSSCLHFPLLHSARTLAAATAIGGMADNLDTVNGDDNATILR